MKIKYVTVTMLLNMCVLFIHILLFSAPPPACLFKSDKQLLNIPLEKRVCTS